MDFVAFSLGYINMYWYGLIIGLALIVGLIITKLSTKLYNEHFEYVIEMIVWSIPCSIICARIAYVIEEFDYYKINLDKICYIWQGGLSIYGALIGFLAVAIWYLRKHKLDLWRWLDIMIPAVIFGIMVLQLANFMLQFSIGLPLGADLPNDHALAEYVEYQYRPSGFEGYLYFQPVALYQGMVEFVIFLFVMLLILFNRWINLCAKGTIFLLGIFLTALSRFIFGFMYLGMNKDMFLESAQWIAIVVMCAVCLVYMKKRLYKVSGKVRV